MSNQSRTYQLIEERLDEPLDTRVLDARARGESWGQIARELDYDTHVPVTDATVRNWFNDADKARLTKTSAA